MIPKTTVSMKETMTWHHGTGPFKCWRAFLFLSMCFHILLFVFIILTNKADSPDGKTCIDLSGRTWVRSQVPANFIFSLCFYRLCALPFQAPPMRCHHLAIGFIASQIQRLNQGRTMVHSQAGTTGNHTHGMGSASWA